MLLLLNDNQTTVCYFLVDLLWVLNIPQCVKSPGVIIKVSYIVHRIFFSIVHSNSHYTLTSFEKASHCCNHVSQWANILATLPLGNGGMLVC